MGTVGFGILGTVDFGICRNSKSVWGVMALRTATFSIPVFYSTWNLGMFPWTRLIVLGVASPKTT